MLCVRSKRSSRWASSRRSRLIPNTGPGQLPSSAPLAERWMEGPVATGPLRRGLARVANGRGALPAGASAAFACHNRDQPVSRSRRASPSWHRAAGRLGPTSLGSVSCFEPTPRSRPRARQPDWSSPSAPRIRTLSTAPLHRSQTRGSEKGSTLRPSETSSSRRGVRTSPPQHARRSGGPSTSRKRPAGGRASYKIHRRDHRHRRLHAMGTSREANMLQAPQSGHAFRGIAAR